MNAMLYVRGRPLDYDLWERAGRDGLGLGRRAARTSCKPEDNERGASEFHGAGGPMQHRRPALAAPARPPLPRRRRRRPGSRASTTTTARAGRRVDVPGLPEDGRRWSAADAYLRPAMKRPEPRGGHGRDGARARARRRARRPASATAAKAATRSPRAEREVILAAGAIGSPQILLLSRHRPGRRSCGRSASESRHELPGVGQNLQDHPFFTLLWEISRADDALRRRQAQEPGRVGAAPQRAADVDGRRGRRLRPHPAGSARGRHPVPHGRRLLRGPRRGGVRRARDRRSRRCSSRPQARGRVRLRSADPPTSRASSPTRSPSPTTSRSMVGGHEAGPRDRGDASRWRARSWRELKPGPDVAADEELDASTCASGSS